jgi:hypothetical protein
MHGCQMVSFSDQKSQFGYILEDLGMENVVLYSGHLKFFTTIWYILWAFGNFLVILAYSSPLWYIVPIKIWQPCFHGCSMARFSAAWRVSCARIRTTIKLKKWSRIEGALPPACAMGLCLKQAAW